MIHYLGNKVRYMLYNFFWGSACPPYLHYPYALHLESRNTSNLASCQCCFSVSTATRLITIFKCPRVSKIDSHYISFPPGVGVKLVKTEFLSNALLQWELPIQTLCFVAVCLYKSSPSSLFLFLPSLASFGYPLLVWSSNSS